MPAMQDMSPSAAQVEQGFGGIPQGDSSAMGGAPSASPMSTPQEPQGQREDALINVHMALDLLEAAVGKLGSETPEGQMVMKSLGALTKVFGGKRQDTEQLGNTEILGLLNKLPQAGGGSPEMKTAMSQPMVPGMQGTPPAPMQGAM